MLTRLTSWHQYERGESGDLLSSQHFHKGSCIYYFIFYIAVSFVSCCQYCIPWFIDKLSVLSTVPILLDCILLKAPLKHKTTLCKSFKPAYILSANVDNNGFDCVCVYACSKISHEPLEILRKYSMNAHVTDYLLEQPNLRWSPQLIPKSSKPQLSRHWDTFWCGGSWESFTKQTLSLTFHN